LKNNKIDQAIADYIKKTFNLAIGDRTAEEIKIKMEAKKMYQKAKYEVKLVEKELAKLIQKTSDLELEMSKMILAQ
jgi:actin-like ATPase involved in cell morphogenesis